MVMVGLDMPTDVVGTEAFGFVTRRESLRFILRGSKLGVVYDLSSNYCKCLHTVDQLSPAAFINYCQLLKNSSVPIDPGTLQCHGLSPAPCGEDSGDERVNPFSLATRNVPSTRVPISSSIDADRLLAPSVSVTSDS